MLGFFPLLLFFFQIKLFCVFPFFLVPVPLLTDRYRYRYRERHTHTSPLFNQDRIIGLGLGVGSILFYFIFSLFSFSILFSEMDIHLPPNFNIIPSNFKSTPFPTSRSLFSSSRGFPARWKSHRPHRLRCSKSPPESAAVDAFTKYSGYLFEGGMSEAEYLEQYNLSKIASIYLRKPFLVLRRLFQIGTSFGRWFGLRYLDSVLERSDQMFEVWLSIRLDGIESVENAW